MPFDTEKAKTRIRFGVSPEPTPHGGLATFIARYI
jgi:hypothetical protein